MQRIQPVTTGSFREVQFQSFAEPSVFNHGYRQRAPKLSKSLNFCQPPTGHGCKPSAHL